MKKIDIDDELYTYIASHTQHIGESASSILRRLLGFSADSSDVGGFSPAHVALGSDSGSASGNDELARGMSGSRTVFDILTLADLANQKGAVGRFLFILSMLHRCHSQDFPQVLDIRGRNRLYFAASEAQLLAAGNSTNPKQIPDTAFWVVTNNNTTKKKSILTEVALELGYSASDAEKIRDFLS
ncbi:replication initiation negative regulator SeqA [Aliidiomarina iranensis]|uniref:Negative modulator of initiation of replication n=1 Tax=Aliidiomarina iranensis TaxID=1434071 RepID=A0A432VZP3_9GAMM|nr:replication initiation negative regulator SeqA [Aliidiomarina iranensis]RUO22208.1 replication initiation negative regulator SeqA [Aliidiomarina iranensis]